MLKRPANHQIHVRKGVVSQSFSVNLPGNIENNR